eukprot:UN14973
MFELLLEDGCVSNLPSHPFCLACVHVHFLPKIKTGDWSFKTNRT